jgi:hypothetical protein
MVSFTLSDITELNDEEDNDEDDKSDTEDDAVVDSVDALPDFFTEYWDVLEENLCTCNQDDSNQFDHPPTPPTTAFVG